MPASSYLPESSYLHPRVCMQPVPSPVRALCVLQVPTATQTSRWCMREWPSESSQTASCGVVEVTLTLALTLTMTLTFIPTQASCGGTIRWRSTRGLRTLYMRIGTKVRRSHVWCGIGSGSSRITIRSVSDTCMHAYAHTYVYTPPPFSRFLLPPQARRISNPLPMVAPSFATRAATHTLASIAARTHTKLALR